MSPIVQKLGRAVEAGKIWLEYFVIALRWDALAIGATEDQSDAVPADSDFLLERVNSFCRDGGADVASPDVLIAISDGGSSRLFQSQRRGASLPTVSGKGGSDFDLPQPRVIVGGSTVTATIENLSGVALDTIHVSLIGAKIYYAPGVTREQVFGFIK